MGSASRTSRKSLNKVLPLCLCASVLNPTGLTHAQSVTELGPAPASFLGQSVGRIASVACHPIDPNLYYVGAADGGLWKTTDGGTTWTPLSDNWPTTAIGAVTLDPTNPSTIYVGTGEANFANHSRYGLGLMKSTNAGATWTQLGAGTFSGRCFSKIAINASAPQRLFVGITRAGGFPEMAGAKGHSQKDGPEGVFMSDNGGVNWIHQTNGIPALSATDVVIDPSNQSTVYAAIGRIFGSTQNGIYKTTNAGTSWTKLAGGLPSGNVGRVNIAISPSNPNRLYAVFVNPATATGGNAGTMSTWRSDNAGTTWTAINIGGFQATYGWYLSVIGVHPTQPDIAFFGGLTLERTTNAGASTSDVTTPHVDNHALAFDASGRLLCGDDGGLHRSQALTPQQLGNSWTHLNTNLGTMQFYAGLSTHPTNDLFILGGKQDNGSSKRTTNTKAWSGVTGGDGGWTQINQLNPSIMFTESQGTGNLNRSTNGGVNWNGAGAGIDGNDPNCFLPPFVCDPTNMNRALYATNRIYESTDAGASWTPISAAVTGNASAAIRALAIAPTSGQHVYVATNDFRVLSSTDGGKNFTLRLTDAAGWPRVTRELMVDPQDPLTVYLAGATFNAPNIRRSTNGGATWQTLDGTLPDIPVNAIAIDKRCAAPTLFAGSDAGLYQSSNDGATWTKVQSIPSACIIDLQFDAKRGRLLIGTQGRGAWMLDVPIASDADCDSNGVLSIDDFICFQTLYAINDPKADCDADGVLSIDDFICYQTIYAIGC